MRTIKWSVGNMIGTIANNHCDFINVAFTIHSFHIPRIIPDYYTF